MQSYFKNVQNSFINIKLYIDRHHHKSYIISVWLREEYGIDPNVLAETFFWSPTQFANSVKVSNPS